MVDSAGKPVDQHPTSQERETSLIRSVSQDSTGLGSLRHMQVWEAVMNNAAYMLAPFLMPSIINKLGWIAGFVFLAFSNTVTYSTGLLLGEICTAHPHLHSYPVMAEEAFRIIGGDWCRFGINGQARCALGGRIFVQTIQIVTYYLAGVCELIYLMQYFSQLLPHAQVGGRDMCQFDWLLVSAACCWPFMQIPDFHESRWAAFGTILLVAFGLLVAFYEIFLVAPWTCVPGPEYPTATFSSLMVGMTSLSYAYGGHGLYPELLREMQDKTKWPVVMNWTYCIVTPIYIFLGFLGYYAFGAHAHPNLNANFPANKINTAAIIALLIGEFYYVYFSVLVVMLQVELALGVDPTAWCQRTKLVLPEEGLSFTRSMLAGAAADPAAQATPQEQGEKAWREWLSGRRLGIPPVGFRIIFRTFFLGTMVFVTAVLLGGGGGLLLSIQALSGAIGFVMFIYVLPILFGWVLLPQKQTMTLVYHAVSFFIGLVVFFAGTYFASIEVVKSAGAFGDATTCHYYGYNYYGGGSHYGCEAALGKGGDGSSANSSSPIALLYS